jgi:hypothetical protein
VVFVTEHILTIPELSLEPRGAPLGSAAADYATRTVRAHAIRVADGVGEPTSVCGEFVHGELLDVPFDATEVSARCARCADLLGLPHAPS